MEWVEWPMVRIGVEDSGKGWVLESFRGSCGKENFSWEGMAPFHRRTNGPCLEEGFQDRKYHFKA
jgi:hypothetical protein